MEKAKRKKRLIIFRTEIISFIQLPTPSKKNVYLYISKTTEKYFANVDLKIFNYNATIYKLKLQQKYF